MMNGQPVSRDTHHVHDHCSPWSAIFIGAFIGVGLGFLLNLFYIAIGLSVFTVSQDGMITLAIGGLVGLAIGIIASMYTAGYAAGYLTRPHCHGRNLGVAYGFTTWCIALLITVFFTMHVGRFISSYSNFISNPSTIVITEDETAPAVSAKKEPHANNTAVVVSAVKITNGLAMGAFLVFIFFCIGALSSCFGGYFGMACRHCTKGK